ncbi:MAG TPA: hypothetical protein VK174_12885 [Chitinophagales bacterium]|nr:hypothetical protein [Chitinophagales bacterium]
MKTALLSVFIMLFTAPLFSQDIDYDKKKSVVLVDTKECLKYDGKEVPGVTYSSLAGEELFFIGFARDKYGNTYWHVVFLKSKKEMNYRVNFASKKAFLAKAVKDGLLKDCTLNEEKLDNFILKYDERIALIDSE